MDSGNICHILLLVHISGTVVTDKVIRKELRQQSTNAKERVSPNRYGKKWFLCNFRHVLFGHGSNSHMLLTANATTIVSWNLLSCSGIK